MKTVRVRWWVPILGLLIGWLGACWPICAQAQEVRTQSTDRQTREMAQELQRLTAQLGFERWVLVLKLDTLPGDVIARTWPRLEYRLALVVADSVYFQAFPRLWCETGVHEALHLKFLPLRLAILAFVVDSLAVAQVLQVEEAIVSDLARLPLWGCSR